MSIVALAEWHKTILLMIIFGAVLAGGAKIWALKTRWGDKQEIRRILLIAACMYCAWLNTQRYLGEIHYDPVALAWGSIYIIAFELGILWMGVREW